MSILLSLLLATSPATADAPADATPPAPPAVAAATASVARDLMPVFVTYCMKPGLGPTDVADHLTSLGVKPIRDPRPDVPELERKTSFVFMAGDRLVNVITEPMGCAVIEEGVHDAASLASFEKFLRSAAAAYDVEFGTPPAPTANERMVSVVQLVDKNKQHRTRYTLSVGSRNGASPATIIARRMGAY